MAEVPPVAAVAGAPKARKPSGPSVTELLTQAVSSSKDRSGISLAALKKSLAASGYDVEKNNSRIKLGLKSLVSKGVLVQIKGTGASGSFKLAKKPAEVGAKVAKKAPPTAAKNKKPAATPKKAKKVVAKKAAKKAVPAKKAVKSPAKAKVTNPKKTTKSPAKALKPKAKAKPKPSKAKVVSRK